MSENQKPFKRPPKKYEPRGLSILYEDRDILVVDKVSGLLTMGTDRVQESTAHFLLNEYVRKGNSKSNNRIFIVHRLDQETSGVLVFAKTEQAKRFLQEEWSSFQKKYTAVVCGISPEKEGLITSYLAENSAYKMYSCADPLRGKLARTSYRVVKESVAYSLLEIELLTGRKNQIRVHLADKGCPVAGDKKYGTRDKSITRLALHSTSIALIHPFSKKAMTFEAKIPTYFSALMRNSRSVDSNPAS